MFFWEHLDLGSVSLSGGTYLGPHDLSNGRVELLGVVEVHGQDMGSADVLFSIGVLRGYL